MGARGRLDRVSEIIAEGSICKTNPKQMLDEICLLYNGVGVREEYSVENVLELLSAVVADCDEEWEESIVADGGYDGYAEQLPVSYSGSLTWESAEPQGQTDKAALNLLDGLPYVPRRLKHQNLAYKTLGMYVVHLAGMGATDSELNKLMAKGKNATLMDVAKIYMKHLREDDNQDGWL